MLVYKNIIPLSTAQRPTDNKGRKLIEVRYLVLHETGNESKTAGAMSHVNYETKNSQGINNTASYHFVVDDLMVAQLLELDDRSIAAGGKDRRNATLPLKDQHSYLWNIEMCINNYKTDPVKHKKCIDTAIELAAILCHKAGKKPEDVNDFIRTHTDFINPASKTCPYHILKDKVPYSIEVVKQKIAEKLVEVIANPEEYQIKYA